MKRQKKYIYLDNNATTPLFFAVKKILIENAFEYWGNASSAHWAGRKTSAKLYEERLSVASFFKVKPYEIIFTANGTESNNTIIKGIFFREYFKKINDMPYKNKFIISSVEHSSILEPINFIKEMGAEILFVPIKKNGEVDLLLYKKLLDNNTALVSFMYANNETGIVFPLKKMIKLAHEKNILFHSDMVQALGKKKFDLKSLDVDFATFSTHKFYSLKGCGLLYVKEGLNFKSLLHGGNQEKKRRAGTENLLSIMSFTTAIRKLEPKLSDNIKKMENFRDYMEEQILSSIDDVYVVGKNSKRIVNTSCIIIKNVYAGTLIDCLDVKGIAIGSGAACNSNKEESGMVLNNMGYSSKEANCAIRISLGWLNTKKEIDYFIGNLIQEVKRIRKLL